MRIVVLAISLGFSTLSASAMELGSAAPLSIQQLDRQRYVPRLPNAPGPPIVREVKSRVENLLPRCGDEQTARDIQRASQRAASFSARRASEG